MAQERDAQRKVQLTPPSFMARSPGLATVADAYNHNSTALAYRRKGQLKEAYLAYSDALELFVASSETGEMNANVGMTLSSMGQVQKSTGNEQEALDLHRRCLRIRESLHGEHADTAASANSVALSAYSLAKEPADFEEAATAFTRAACIWEAIGVDSRSERVLNAWRNAANAHAQAKETKGESLDRAEFKRWLENGRTFDSTGAPRDLLAAKLIERLRFAMVKRDAKKNKQPKKWNEADIGPSDNELFDFVDEDGNGDIDREELLYYFLNLE